MKFPLELLAFLLFYFTTFSQVRDSVQEKHIKFFQNISKNGGVWVAENPKYDKAKLDDFKLFILKMTQPDTLSIHGEILGINTRQDTTQFWKFTDFYAPHRENNVYYQRSKDGRYYAIGESTMTTTERFCEMSFYHSEGEYLKHKDTHTFIDENSMRSVSYDYDPDTEQWTNESILIWKLKD